MHEIGVDLSSHHRKHLDDFRDQDIDTIITVCENAESCCSEFEGGKNHYCWAFADPVQQMRQAPSPK